MVFINRLTSWCWCPSTHLSSLQIPFDPSFMSMNLHGDVPLKGMYYRIYTRLKFGSYVNKGALKKKDSTPLKTQFWTPFFDLLGGIPSIRSFNLLNSFKEVKTSLRGQRGGVRFFLGLHVLQTIFLGEGVFFLMLSSFSNFQCFFFRKKRIPLPIHHLFDNRLENRGLNNFCWGLRSTSTARWWGMILDGDLDLNVQVWKTWKNERLFWEKQVWKVRHHCISCVFLYLGIKVWKELCLKLCLLSGVSCWKQRVVYTRLRWFWSTDSNETSMCFCLLRVIDHDFLKIILLWLASMGSLL